MFFMFVQKKILQRTAEGYILNAVAHLSSASRQCYTACMFSDIHAANVTKHSESPKTFLSSPRKLFMISVYPNLGVVSFLQAPITDQQQ